MKGMWRARLPGERLRDAQLDRYLLELILIDSLAVLDPRRGSTAERMISQCIPRHLYECVMERYDHLTGNGDQADVLACWLPRAAALDSRWKCTMILRFMRIVCVEGRLTEAGLADMAVLVRGMRAERECRRLFALALASDPVGQLPGAAMTCQGGLSWAIASYTGQLGS